jgi:hypothetical protein
VTAEPEVPLHVYRLEVRSSSPPAWLDRELARALRNSVPADRFDLTRDDASERAADLWAKGLIDPAHATPPGGSTNDDLAAHVTPTPLASEPYVIDDARAEAQVIAEARARVDARARVEIMSILMSPSYRADPLPVTVAMQRDDVVRFYREDGGAEWEPVELLDRLRGERR